MTDIRNHLLLGNGYMSSRFVNIVVDDMAWDAGHLHNGFLEVLYNNGLLGLIPMLMIQITTVRNAVRALRFGLTPQIRTLAAGCLAIYLYLLLNALVEATFGGRATSFFMLLVTLLPFSEFIKSQTVTEREMVCSPSAQACSPSLAG
jgi:O-antigen ligase